MLRTNASSMSALALKATADDWPKRITILSNFTNESILENLSSTLFMEQPWNPDRRSVSPIII
jgi:hypothetical protein